jgi:F-type H+-transporting ATPase subunit delta
MSVAKAYARALYETAAGPSGEGRPDLLKVEEQLKDFSRLVSSSREAKVALFGPVATSKEKAAIIEGLAKKLGLMDVVTRFLSLLAMKGRLPIVSEIQEAFSIVRVEAEGGVIGSLVAADPIEQQDVETLSRAFAKKLGKKVFFRVSTDPALLAGMKVTVNGVTYDGSLRSQLHKLRDQVTVGALAD